MPTASELRLQNAGIDTKNMPTSAIDALARLSDAELAALVKAQKGLAPLGGFGGIIF